MKTRVAAALPIWALFGIAGLAATLSFTAVRATRAGCVSNGMADVIAVGGIAGLGLGLATLLLTWAVPQYRSRAVAIGTLLALGLSIYAVVTFLTRDGGACF
jgi:hypothetical protein